MKLCIVNFIVYVYISVYLLIFFYFFRNLLFGRENLGILENLIEWFVYSKKYVR